MRTPAPQLDCAAPLANSLLGRLAAGHGGRPPGHPGRADAALGAMDDQRRRPTHRLRRANRRQLDFAAARQRPAARQRRLAAVAGLSTAWPRWARRCFRTLHTRTPRPRALAAQRYGLPYCPARCVFGLPGEESAVAATGAKSTADLMPTRHPPIKTSSRLSICRFDVFKRKQTSHTIRTQQLLCAGQRGSQVWLHIALANMLGQLPSPPASWRCRRRLLARGRFGVVVVELVQRQ